MQPENERMGIAEFFSPHSSETGCSPLAGMLNAADNRSSSGPGARRQMQGSHPSEIVESPYLPRTALNLGQIARLSGTKVYGFETKVYSSLSSSLMRASCLSGTVLGVGLQSYQLCTLYMPALLL